MTATLFEDLVPAVRRGGSTEMARMRSELLQQGIALEPPADWQAPERGK